MNFSDFISLTFFFAVSMIMKFERKRFFWWNSSIKSVQYVCNINFGFYRFSTFWFLSWYSYRFFYVRSQTSLNCIIQGGHVLKLRSARGCRAIFFFGFLAFLCQVSVTWETRVSEEQGKVSFSYFMSGQISIIQNGILNGDRKKTAETKREWTEYVDL